MAKHQRRNAFVCESLKLVLLVYSLDGSVGKGVCPKPAGSRVMTEPIGTDSRTVCSDLHMYYVVASHPKNKFTNVQTSLCANRVLPLLCMCEQGFEEKGIPKTQEAKIGRGHKFKASMSYMMRKNKEKGGNAAS